MSLKTIKERADAATPGPWVRGWWSGQLPGNKFHADCKERGPLLGTLPGGYHVHPDDFYEDAHHLSMGAAPFTTVAGNYDYEAGGILSDPDADFIAHARQDISALLRVAEAAARDMENCAGCKADERGYCYRHNETGPTLRDLDALP